jgi:hypothetical protein
MIHARADYQARIVDLKNEIPADEPVLLIRGQDQFASATLDCYIELVRKARQELEDEAGANNCEYGLEGAAEMNKEIMAEADRLFEVEKAVVHHQRLVNLWPKKKSPDITKT